MGTRETRNPAIQDQRYARPDGDRHRRHALSLQMGRPYLQRIAVITRIDETGALPPRIFFHNYFPHCCGRNRLNDAPRGSASVKFLTRSVRNQLAPIPLLRAQSCFCLPGVKRHGNTGFMRLAYRNFEVTGHRASAGLKTGGVEVTSPFSVSFFIHFTISTAFFAHFNIFSPLVTCSMNYLY